MLNEDIINEDIINNSNIINIESSIDHNISEYNSPTMKSNSSNILKQINNNINNQIIDLENMSFEDMNNLINNDTEYRECCEMSTCCKRLVRFEVDNHIIIKLLPISPFKKEILRRRYSLNIGDYQQKRDYIRCLYRLFQVIITIGSIIVPSLLSIQMTAYIKTNYEIEVGMSVLILSIIVSICTSIIHLFRMDELYYNYAITLEKMKTLWYKYVSLSGPFINTTHDESFNILILMMENIIMNQKIQEYVDNKSEEVSNDDKNKNNINENMKLIQNYKSV